MPDIIEQPHHYRDALKKRRLLDIVAFQLDKIFEFAQGEVSSPFVWGFDLLIEPPSHHKKKPTQEEDEEVVLPPCPSPINWAAVHNLDMLKVVNPYSSLYDPKNEQAEANEDFSDEE